MIDAIASAVVELARYAVLAYAIKHTRAVLVHWLDCGQPGLRATAEERIVDLARSTGIDLGALAQKVAE